MHGIGFIKDLAVVMIVAGVVTLIFQRLRQPVVLGYILAGLIIGPNTIPFPLISNQDTIKTLADLGVVFLMFALGLEFNLRKLRKVGAPSLIVAVFEILLMILAGYQLGYFFGWNQMDRIFLGIMLALTSTTIVVKSLRDRGELREAHGELISGACLYEDIFVIIVMVLLPGFAKTGAVEASRAGLTLLQLFIFLVAVVILGLLLVPKLIRFTARFKSDEMLLIVVLALCFGLALTGDKFGFSTVLGAFLIGAIIAESREVGRIENLTAPLRDMFSAVFFVAMGMLIDLRDVYEYAGPVLAITLVYVFFKICACAFGSFLAGYDARTAFRVGTGMAQLGEFALILATMGESLKVTGSQLYPVVVSVAAINAFIRPYLVGNADRLAAAVTALAPGPVRAAMNLYPDWLSRLRRERKHSTAYHFVRNLAWQIVLNVALIAGLYMGATFLAARFDFKILPEALGGMKTFCWLGVTVVCLPVYVATVRKMHALGMMIAEIGVPISIAGSRANMIRLVITYVVLVGGIAALMVVTVLISSALLPPWQILSALVAVIGFCVVLFGRVLNKWYSRAKFDLLETLHNPPPQESSGPKTVPDFLKDADLRTVTIPPGPVAGKLIRELQLRTQTGVSVVAIERAGKPILNPGPDEELHIGDKVLLLGTPAQLEIAETYLHGEKSAQIC